MGRLVERRPNDSGTVRYDRRSGRWYAWLPRRYGRRPVGSFATEAEAHEALADALERMATEGAPDDLTLASYGRGYFERRVGDPHYRSADKDAARWECYVTGSRLGGRMVHEVREMDVRRWLRGLKRQDGKPLAGQSQANVLACVRWVLEDARIYGYVAENVAVGIRLPKGARAKAEQGWTWLTVPEIRRILSDARLTAHQRTLLTVGVYAGLRAGELCGLRWRDVDFARGVLTVWRSRTGPTKGGVGREVPLLPPAMEALEQWRGQCDRGELVWPARDGRCHVLGYSAGLPGALRRAGVTRRVRFHDLRHTCASHLAMGSWAPGYLDAPLRLEEIRDWLGHSDVGVTQRYAHLAADGLSSKVVRAGAKMVCGGTESPKAPVAQRTEQRFPKPTLSPHFALGRASLLTGHTPGGWKAEEVNPGPVTLSLSVLDGLEAMALEVE